MASPQIRPEEEGARERDLLLRAQSGDDEAFCELVRLHQARLQVYLAYHLPTSQEVEDLAQTVFMTAHRKLPAFDPQQALRPWLLGIAQRSVLQHLRNEGRRRARDSGSIEESLHLARLRMLDAEGESIQRDRRLAALADCIERLPDPSARLIRERYFEQRPLAEIAARRQRQPGAVRMALLRVRQLLRECLEGSAAGEPG